MRKRPKLRSEWTSPHLLRFYVTNLICSEHRNRDVVRIGVLSSAGKYMRG